MRVNGVVMAGALGAGLSVAVTMATERFAPSEGKSSNVRSGDIDW